MLPVSIVISTRDRHALLRGAIDSILAGDELPAELIVADRSTRAEPALPDGGPVKVIHLRLSSTGSTRAMNAGIAAAWQDVIVVADDDIVADREWLRRLSR